METAASDGERKSISGDGSVESGGVVAGDASGEQVVQVKNWFHAWKRFCMPVHGLWEGLEAFGGSWGVLGASGRSLERLGQALECLNCVLEASWGRLGGFWRRPEVNLSHLRGFLGRLRTSWDHFGTSQASF